MAISTGVAMLAYFNSIKVQLKHKTRVSTLTDKLFQFHKGTIKTLSFLNLLFYLLHFNSIKVQLKRGLARGLCRRQKDISIP